MLSKRFGIVLTSLAAVLSVVAIVAIALGAYFYSLSATLAGATVDSIAATSKRTTVVYAADGTAIDEWHGAEDRKIVELGQMNPVLVDAVIAIEDHRFYEHHGFDIQGMSRALSRNASAGEVREGGSTITQQLAKLLFTGGERTLSRKIRELVLANQLELQVSKADVLELYLNTVYFGNGAYGVERASQRYFGKPADSLTVAESALLAGVIRSPSTYDPVRNPEKATQRRDLVLDVMREQRKLTRTQWEEAKAQPVVIAAPQKAASLAPHFVDSVRQELIEVLGPDKVYGGGLSVYTTIEPAIQKEADKAASVFSADDEPEVALVAVRPSNGHVVAMVGGRDFSENQFNLAAQGKRQPGSAFKPFVLVAALEEGISPKTVVDAAPFEVEVKDGVWHVQNYENRRTAGSVSLSAATRWSVNAVFARLIMKIGPEKVVDVASRMGIESPLDPDPAIALGGLKHGVSPLEMASAYGTLANEGVHVKPRSILRVVDDQGTVLYQPEPATERAVDKSIARTASSVLHDVIEDGTGSRAKIGTWAAGKTGTTQSYRDAWFVGWSKDISTAVWVGFPEAQVAMDDIDGDPVTGGSYPARIWASFMKKAIKAAPEAPDPESGAEDQSLEGVVVVRICDETGELASPSCPRTTEIALPARSVPEGICRKHK